MTSFGILTATAMSGGQDLDFLVSPGPLHRAHSELIGLSNCSNCHSSETDLGPEKCLACHKDLDERIRAQRGFHARKPDRCFECHKEHQGEDFPLVNWEPRRFNHDEAGYRLFGLHDRVQACERCHHAGNSPPRQKTQTFFLNDTRCIACHEDVHKKQLGQDCQRCHSVEVEFRQIRFDHDRTAFSLVGAHRQVDCDNCHRAGRWKGVRFAQCTDCHNDPHPARLGNDCRRCHGSKSWTVGRFDHERTRYPLRGMHRPVPCSRCHFDKRVIGVDFANCSDCHTRDPHAGQFDDDCSRCHVVDGFRQTTFDHAQASYPLTGKHTELKCADCHRLETGGFPSGMAEAVRYKPLQTECTSCHKDIHLGQFEKACSSCHTTDAFDPARVRFEHNRDSRFPLAGRHSDVICRDCHKREQALFPAGEGLTVRYRPLSDECIGCHDNVHDRSWWTGAKSSVRSDCQACHSVDTFAVDNFDHNRTVFPLTGKHSTLKCDQCHDSVRRKDHEYLLFQKTSLVCANCHRSPHLKGLERCTDCHTTENWRVTVW